MATGSRKAKSAKKASSSARSRPARKSAGTVRVTVDVDPEGNVVIRAGRTEIVRVPKGQSETMTLDCNDPPHRR